MTTSRRQIGLFYVWLRYYPSPNISWIQKESKEIGLGFFQRDEQSRIKVLDALQCEDRTWVGLFLAWQAAVGPSARALLAVRPEMVPWGTGAPGSEFSGGQGESPTHPQVRIMRQF